MENNLIMAILFIALTAFSAAAAAIAMRARREATEAKETAHRALNTARTAETAIRCLKDMIPADLKEESLRRDVLMKDMNDELEKRVQAERMWNETVASILNFDATGAGVNDNGRR